MLAPAEQPQHSSIPQDLGAVTVVLAEDNDRFRDGLVRALNRCRGVRMLATVTDGQEALAAARRLRPDVLVLDQRMPGLTGLQVTERLRADPELADVRVVILSANDDPDFPRRASAAGAASLIDKASSRREICAAIEDVGRS